SGNCDQEVQNFVQTLEKVKQLVPNGDSLRLEKLRSFGEGEVLEQRDEKLLWQRLENDLKNVELNKLPYNHPLCSGILDIESSPISDLPETLRDVFEKNTKLKFCMDNNEMLLQTCEEFIQEVSIRVEEPLLEARDPPFGQWIENSEKLKNITKRLLET
ncbi:7194_t:CDS:2, partial [Racocetra fulgida]